MQKAIESIREGFKERMPSPLVDILQRVLNSKRMLTIRRQRFFCPLCELSVSGIWCFSDLNLTLKCSDCQSLSRHRLFALWKNSKSGFLTPDKRIIHFAPEPSLIAYFKKIHVGTYLTADLYKRSDLKVNIECADLPCDSFDVLVANHVLEHVDDNKAIQEIWRILKPDGVALVTVPLVFAWNATYENTRVILPSDREIHFGQFDHTRFYGRSIRDKFTDAGFLVSEFIASGSDCAEYGLERGEILFELTKRQG